jgi:hypothetical protein
MSSHLSICQSLANCCTTASSNYVVVGLDGASTRLGVGTSCCLGRPTTNSGSLVGCSGATNARLGIGLAVCLCLAWALSYS